MKKVYLVHQTSYDYDMIQNVLVVADNEEEAKRLGTYELQDHIFYNENNEYPVIVQEIDLTITQTICHF